ncbi:MlaA family lipoprotein [Erythrobacter mangrovi]|uniref:VacJ family lipoprotein n=1 Tax=Erythrobacter mangrovi TaxID=2739433 RepID=A0A7D4B8Q9_9SPHN|nr:VacJ family lipoprotein [Erythrobacter mangrovi]QKG70461.1 VacJ family lipoprotein [Erythrobacter mangrovi]
MGVSSLALAAALASVQPQCEADVPCLPATEIVEAEQAAPVDQVDVPVAVQTDDDAPAPVEEIAPPAEAILPEEQPVEGPTGETIVVTGGTPEGDPAQQFNAATFETVQKIDEAVVAPLAEAYDEGVPKPIRSGLRNFLRNLGEPINFLNFMLQLKPGRAMKSLGRFAINTTIGVAGLFDPASKAPFKLKHESNGLANTLAFYGVGPGPYLYLPFIGSTTVRDLFGRVVDLSIIPAVAGKPFNQPVYAISAGALNSLESRILIDEQIEAVRDQCGDAYSATRDIYLIGRQLEIDGLRGRESEELGELVERLKVNCDISVIRAATEQARYSFGGGETGDAGAVEVPATAPVATVPDEAPVETIEPVAPVEVPAVPSAPDNDTEQNEPLAVAG